MARGLDIFNITHVVNFECQTCQHYTCTELQNWSCADKTGTAIVFIAPREEESSGGRSPNMELEICHPVESKLFRTEPEERQLSSLNEKEEALKEMVLLQEKVLKKNKNNLGGPGVTKKPMDQP
jgi:ATP-dependent RNA helicase RhlE